MRVHLRPQRCALGRVVPRPPPKQARLSTIFSKRTLSTPASHRRPSASCATDRCNIWIGPPPTGAAFPFDDSRYCDERFTGSTRTRSTPESRNRPHGKDRCLDRLASGTTKPPNAFADGALGRRLGESRTVRDMRVIAAASLIKLPVTPEAHTSDVPLLLARRPALVKEAARDQAATIWSVTDPLDVVLREARQ